MANCLAAFRHTSGFYFLFSWIWGLESEGRAST